MNKKGLELSSGFGWFHNNLIKNVNSHVEKAIMLWFLFVCNKNDLTYFLDLCLNCRLNNSNIKFKLYIGSIMYDSILWFYDDKRKIILKILI